METKDIIKRVRKIELKTKKLTNHLFMGEYQSSFKGRGMIFSEVRPYQFGDDVRSIDWNKTAHFNQPYIKVFEEERELTLLLLVDISASQYYGSRKQIKKETLAEIAAMLAFSAVGNNDKVGLVLYTNKVEKYLAPKKGKAHVLRIIREIVEFQPSERETQLSNALDFILHTQKRRANVFILSDFIDSDYKKSLTITSKRHDITGIRIYDEKEKEFPDVGLIQVRDKETGELKYINTSVESSRKHYQSFYENITKEFLDTFQKSGAGTINLQADQAYVKPLLNYFKSHGKR